MMEIYPVVPAPSFSFVTEEEFKTLTVRFGEAENPTRANEQRWGLQRFPSRWMVLGYKTQKIASEWNILHNFFRKVRGGNESFWVIDPYPLVREWSDEYVGRGTIIALIGAKIWKDSAYTNYLTEASNATANDVPLLDSTPVQEDAFYFCFTSPGDTLRLNIGTAGVGTWVITWEYAKTASWGAFSDLVDGSNGFHNSGIQDVDFARPSDWVSSTIDGVTGYWMRARLSSYTNMSTQPKGTQIWQAVRLYDLHSKETTESSVKIKTNDVEMVKNTDWFYLVGGGEASADRIRFADPQANGSLITSDFLGHLRMKGVLPDKFRDQMVSIEITDIDTVMIREVQW